MPVKPCPFCDPNQRILRENTLAYALLSNPRKVPGHFLVIPKRHVEKPWELSPEESTAIIELVFFLQKRMAETFSEGCDVRQNYRPFLPQSKLKIDHVHYHVIPRDLRDAIYQRVERYETDLFRDLPWEEHEKIAGFFED